MRLLCSKYMNRTKGRGFHNNFKPSPGSSTIHVHRHLRESLVFPTVLEEITTEESRPMDIDQIPCKPYEYPRDCGCEPSCTNTLTIYHRTETTR